jgi:hypothetical protein
MAGNYLFRYSFAAAGTAACLPVIDKIGVGWFSTISAVLLVISAVATWFVAEYGRSWREGVKKTADEE